MLLLTKFVCTLGKRKVYCTCPMWSSFSTVRAGRSGVRIPTGAKKFFCSPKPPTSSAGIIQPPIKWVPISFRGSKLAVAWSWPLNPIYWWVKNEGGGAVSLLTLYAYMGWTGTPLSFTMWEYFLVCFLQLILSVLTNWLHISNKRAW